MSQKSLATIIRILGFIVLICNNYVLAGNEHGLLASEQKAQRTNLQDVKDFGTKKFAKWTGQMLDPASDWYAMLPVYGEPTIFAEMLNLPEIDGHVTTIRNHLYNIRDAWITNENIHALVATWKPYVDEGPIDSMEFYGDYSYRRRRRRGIGQPDVNQALDRADQQGNKEQLELLKKKENVMHIMGFNPNRAQNPKGEFAWENVTDMDECQTYVGSAMGAVAEFLADQVNSLRPLKSEAFDAIVEDNKLITANKAKAYTRQKASKASISDKNMLLSWLDAFTKMLKNDNASIKAFNEKEKKRGANALPKAEIEKHENLLKSYTELGNKCILIVQVLNAKSKSNISAYEIDLGKALNATPPQARRSKNTDQQQQMLVGGNGGGAAAEEKRGYEKPKRNNNKKGRGRA